MSFFIFLFLFFFFYSIYIYFTCFLFVYILFIYISFVYISFFYHKDLFCLETMGSAARKASTYGFKSVAELLSDASRLVHGKFGLLWNTLIAASHSRKYII